MNLITDKWITVRCSGGEVRVIAPWEIVDTDILRPQWGRADLDNACYEFLIGLLFLACPPADDKDRKGRKNMSAQELKAALEPYAPAFNLTGSGPLFMQEAGLAGNHAPLDIKKLDSLLLDGAGAATIRNNSDLFPHRNQLDRISIPYAAMLLYTLQNYAPAGGRGSRTSVRGGGPMTVLLQPENGSLWDTVWLNVPYGTPGDMALLPWMKPSVMTSETGNKYDCPNNQGFTPEAFFGMPRRICFVVKNDEITQFIQRPYGINYGLWRHPLTPYYRMKPAEDWTARHPRDYGFSYRDYFGVIVDEPPREQSAQPLAELSLNMREFWAGERGSEHKSLNVIVSGWAMENATPLNYVEAEIKIPRTGETGRERIIGAVSAVRFVSHILFQAFGEMGRKGIARDSSIEEFFLQAKVSFYEFQETGFDKDTAGKWLNSVKRKAIEQFNAVTVPGISERSWSEVKRIVSAKKRMLKIMFAHGKEWKRIYDLMRMEHPITKKSITGDAQ